MAFTREVITLQIGNYSNYVGAHWWNIQVSHQLCLKRKFVSEKNIFIFVLKESGFSYDPEGPRSEISNDVLFREGVNQKVGIIFNYPKIFEVIKFLFSSEMYDIHSTFTFD